MSVYYFCFVLETAKLFYVVVLFYIPKCFQNPTTCPALFSPWDHFNSTMTTASPWCSLPYCFSLFQSSNQSDPGEMKFRLGDWLCLRPYNSFSCHPEKSQTPYHDLDNVSVLWLYFQLLSPSLIHYHSLTHHPSQLGQQPPCPALHFCWFHICCALCLEQPSYTPHSQNPWVFIQTPLSGRLWYPPYLLTNLPGYVLLLNIFITPWYATC